MTRHAGSCLCGSVRFEVHGEFEHFYLCHCEYCRKDTGSAHAANLFMSRGRLVWLAGQDNIKRFTVPSTRHSRAFCLECGSALPMSQAEGGLLVVPAGSLDTDVALRSDAHIFVASRAPWDRALEEVTSFESFPS